MVAAIVDTVVLRYFLFSSRFDLLGDLLGAPLGVSRIVYDPDEDSSADEAAMSELTRSIRHQSLVSEDRGRSDGERALAEIKAERLTRVHDRHREGLLTVIDMEPGELAMFAHLTDPALASAELELVFALDPGEAACVAVALGRGLVLVTDDTDALRAAEVLQPGHPYERIRKLLKRAAQEELVTRAEANTIHAAMTQMGFWDRERPFPRTSG